MGREPARTQAISRELRLSSPEFADISPIFGFPLANSARFRRTFAGLRTNSGELKLAYG